LWPCLSLDAIYYWDLYIRVIAVPLKNENFGVEIRNFFHCGKSYRGTPWKNGFLAVCKFELMIFVILMRQIGDQFFYTLFHFVFNFTLTITLKIYSCFSTKRFLNRHLEFCLFYKNSLTICRELIFLLKQL